MNPNEFPVWNPTHDLAKGRVLVEASAGTGKTYQITNLVVRLVAEYGVPIERFLVVTFTRAATAELRGRVRARIAEALAVLADGADPREDEVLQRFAKVATETTDRPREWRTRLERAREDFDQAGISTIHGFCQDVLRRHAFASGIDLDRELVQDLVPLIDELVDDWLLTMRHPMTAAELRDYDEIDGMDRRSLFEIAKAVIDSPDTTFVPAYPQGGAAALEARRVRLEARWAQGGREALEAAFDKLNATFPPKGVKVYVYNGGRFVMASTQAAVDSIGPALTSLDALPSCTFEPAVFREKRGAQIADLGLDWFVDLCDLVEAARGLASERARFADWVRTQAAARMEQRRAQGFADLLRLVRDAIQAEPDGALVRDLRGTYDVALIDEFQDTDATQWAIFESLFGHVGPEGPSHWFYLIGDPKQAIYAFRGADVFVYLKAAQTTTQRFTMRVNQRSDGRLVRAANALFRDAAAVLEQDGLSYVPVGASPRNPASRVIGLSEPDSAPLQVRYIDLGARGRTVSEPGTPFVIARTGPATALAAEVAASDIRALLASGRIVDGALQGGGLAAAGDRDPVDRPIRAGDIAVLVRSHVQGAAMERVLQRLGLPVVRSGVGSVFQSQEALHLERWLAAIAQPTNARLARALAITPLGRWTAPEVALAYAGVQQDDVEDAETGASTPVVEPSPEALRAAANWALWMERIQARARTCGKVPLAQVLGRELSDPAFLAAIANLADADRRMTNYRQLVELLHAVQTERHLGIRGVLAWLRARRRSEGEDDEVQSDGVQLRLETDAAAIRIVTIHTSKGLEYPIVFAPFLWTKRIATGKNADVVFRRHDADKRLVIDARTEIPAPDKERSKAEAGWEGLRMLYVAATRARHRLVVHWPAQAAKRSQHALDAPLARVLFGHAPGKGTRAARGKAFLVKHLVDVPDRNAVLAALDEVVQASYDEVGPTVAVTPSAPPSREPLVLEDAAVALEPAERFPNRSLERVWVRTSYSGLTRNRHADVERPTTLDSDATASQTPALTAAAVAIAEGEHRNGTDEFHDEDTDAASEALERAVPQPTELPETRPDHDGAASPTDADEVLWSDLPGGAEFGTYVHAVLEGLDFDTMRERSGKRRALLPFVEALGTAQGVGEEDDHALLAKILPIVLDTPLGPDAGNVRLRDLTLENRLDELSFDLPIRGGADFRHRVDPVLGADQLRAALGREREGSRVPARYLALVRDASFTLPDLAGFLTGSIDLAYRVGSGSDQRWYVCDYKTNRVAPAWKAGTKVANTPTHYTLPWLQWAMAHHHYYLQYHLYLLALHRYLATRIPDYSYDRHVGGAVYLFLRGMSRKTPGTGIYTDKPPLDVIEALDACFRLPTNGESP